MELDPELTQLVARLSESAPPPDPAAEGASQPSAPSPDAAAAPETRSRTASAHSYISIDGPALVGSVAPCSYAAPSPAPAEPEDPRAHDIPVKSPERPDGKRRRALKWSAEEDAALLRLKEDTPSQHILWQEVAERIGTRHTGVQCRARYLLLKDKEKSACPFSPLVRLAECADHGVHARSPKLDGGQPDARLHGRRQASRCVLSETAPRHVRLLTRPPHQPCVAVSRSASRTTPSSSPTSSTPPSPSSTSTGPSSDRRSTRLARETAATNARGSSSSGTRRNSLWRGRGQRRRRARRTRARRALRRRCPRVSSRLWGRRPPTTESRQSRSRRRLRALCKATSRSPRRKLRGSGNEGRTVSCLLSLHSALLCSRSVDLRCLPARAIQHRDSRFPALILRSSTPCPSR